MTENKNEPAEFGKRDAWEDYRKFYPRRLQAGLLLAVITVLLLAAAYLLHAKNRSVMEPYLNGETPRSTGGGK